MKKKFETGKATTVFARDKFKKTTTATATATSLNKRFNE